MIDLNKLATEIHAAAVEKGFWGVDDAMTKHLAKMHSELSEAVQADRAGVMFEVEREGAKPEGVAAELADFVMMALDYITYIMDDDSEKLLSVDASIETTFDFNDIYLYHLVLALHEVVVDIANPQDCNVAKAFITAVHLPAQWLQARGFDIWDIILQKMEYNKTRPALHGRAY